MTRSRSMNYTNDSYEFRAPHASAAASLMANSYTMGESSTSRPYSSGESSTSRPYLSGETSTSRPYSLGESSTSRPYSTRPSSYYSKFLTVNFLTARCYKIICRNPGICKQNICKKHWVLGMNFFCLLSTTKNKNGVLKSCKNQLT